MATKAAKPVAAKRGRKTGIGALPFSSIPQFQATFYPDTQSHLWQLEEQYRLSGHLDGDPSSMQVDYTEHNPYIGGIAAANGSGKDSFLIAPTIGYFLSKYEMMDIVLTSSSHTQLSGQTQTYIRDLCDTVNTKLGADYFIYKDMSVFCPDTGSRVILFATDEEGRAEGWHPRESGRKFAIILDEVKTIEDRIVQAILRCSGYTHWLEVSSPGPTTGHFYKCCSSAESVYPEPLIPGKQFFRRVTAFECPHLSQVHIERIRKELGEDSPLYRSSVLAEFINATNLFFCPAHLLAYNKLPTSLTYGMPRKAGLDLSLGGAATVLYVRQGANFIGIRDWKHRHEPTLHKLLITAFKDFQLEPQNINVDGGGIGQIIIQRLHEAGWPVNTVKNESTKVADKRHFANIGAELYWRVRRLHEDKLISPPTHPIVISQLTNRKYIYEENSAKIRCVSKVSMHLEGQESPDYSDAYVLSFAGESLSDYQRAKKVEDNTFIDENGQRRWMVGQSISKENLLSLEEQMHFKAGHSLLGPKGLLTDINDYANYKSRRTSKSSHWLAAREPDDVWREQSE